MQKWGGFARKLYQKAPKYIIRVQPRFCSKITLSPDFPTIKSRFLRVFLEASQKSVIFFCYKGLNRRVFKCDFLFLNDKLSP